MLVNMRYEQCVDCGRMFDLADDDDFREVHIHNCKEK